MGWHRSKAGAQRPFLLLCLLEGGQVWDSPAPCTILHIEKDTEKRAWGTGGSGEARRQQRSLRGRAALCQGSNSSVAAAPPQPCISARQMMA